LSGLETSTAFNPKPSFFLAAFRLIHILKSTVKLNPENSLQMFLRITVFWPTNANYPAFTNSNSPQAPGSFMKMQFVAALQKS